MKYRALIAAALGSALLVFGSGALAADDGLSGTAAIRGKNTRNQTIKLGDRTFRINSESVIRDANGERVSLQALAVPDFGRGASDPMLGSMIGRYTATKRGARLILHTLELDNTTD
ncbi:MAG: hypothetical protein GY944_29180 [bacterium]|nr:hypothetical protein [bacterium]